MATITVTPIKTFVSGETVTPTKLNELSQSTVALTAGTIVDADVSASAAIAASKLSTAAQQALLPAGAVMPFAMNSAPSGWLAADGTAVSRSTYATLFAAISTTHGVGNGSTTFNLPDLRGIFVRGSGSQTISGTTYDKTFATKERDAFQGHWHNYHYSGGNRGVASPVNSVDLIDQTNPAAILTDRVKDSIADGTNGTPRTASETRPANIALLYCIKF
jgi:microcystin-dependent protein